MTPPFVAYRVTTEISGFYPEGRDMSDVRQAKATADPGFDIQPTQASAWVGWIFFSGILMIMLGLFQALMGVVALFKNDFYVVGRNGPVLALDYTTWGWVHLLIGVVAIIAGFGVLIGRMWARVIGIILAVVSAVANVAFIGAYPIWSTIVIVMDILIIYALSVHGREVRNTYDG
jgi:hypothetical protein